MSYNAHLPAVVTLPQLCDSWLCNVLASALLVHDMYGMSSLTLANAVHPTAATGIYTIGVYELFTCTLQCPSSTVCLPAPRPRPALG